MKTFPELLEEANAEIKSVSAEELKQQLDNEEIILVDVRSKDVIEAEGQIKPLVAKSFPLKDIQKAQKKFLEKKFIGKIVIKIN